MLCPECFEEKKEDEVCPACGCEEKKERSPFILSQGTILRRQYIIGKVLGVPGGFGITYLGYNQKLETKVAIKEYFPRSLAGRTTDGLSIKAHSLQDEASFKLGMEQFLNEARLLAKFSHPNIIRVIDFFEENGTAYLVMEYHQGINLVEYLKKQGGCLTEPEVRKIMFPILDGLCEIHVRGVLHRDIKPQNIYITEKGTPILLDFGAARHVINSNNRSLSVMMTPGFAPYEQYYKEGKQGAWTDVYGCAATMYYMLTSEAPRDSLERMANKEPLLPVKLSATITTEMFHVLEKGMALLHEDRFQSVQAMQSCLANETVRMAKDQIAATMVLSQSPSAPMDVADKPSFFKKYSLILAVIVFMACLGGGYFYYQHMHNPVNVLAQNGISYTEDSFFNTIKVGDQEAIKLFLQAGMSVNEVQKATGKTPVMIAIEANQPTIVSFLISKGADLTLKDQQGRTSLDLAIKQGNTQIIKQLMDQLKMTTDTVDDKGKTLLDKAIATGNIATVRFFIEQGANINSQDEQGNTLLDKMLASGNQPMVTLLKSVGAKRNINKNYQTGQLNEIKLPYSSTSSFEVDLLGDGIGQNVTINKDNFFKSSVSISQEAKQLNTFNIYGSTYHWYVAYLRDNNTPDLIYFYVAGSGGFINDFKIIGKTGKDTVGILYDDKLGLGRDIGGGAKLSINGNQLIISSAKHQASLEWVGNYFKINRQF